MDFPSFTIRHYLAAALSLLLLQPAQAQDIPAEVQASIQARVDSGDDPSFVIGIINADGPRTVGFGQLGSDDTRIPDAESVYEIGSITKVFTAILLADAVSRGEVRLDDPVAQYLPEGHSLDPGITLAHLSEHTSGLPRMPANIAPADPTDPFADYTPELLYEFLDQVNPPRAPGAGYEYSNLGGGLLGYILARQAGTDYETLLQERVLGPLGLSETSIEIDDQARNAPGTSGGREVSFWRWDALAGAGALRSTAHDMLRFLAANMGMIDTPLDETLAGLHEPRVHVGMADGDSVTAGLGWHFRSGDTGRMIWHNGGTGGFRSFIGFLPEAQRGVVVLSNSDGGADDIGFHLLDPSIPLAQQRPTVVVPPEVLEAYVGTYQLAPGVTMTVSREADRLYAQVTGQLAYRIYPTSETRFFYKTVPAEIEFRRGDDGTVTSLTLFQNGLEIPAERR